MKSGGTAPMSDEQTRITVLLVDDEENILKALQRLLMDEDFDIETASSGEAGLEKLKTVDAAGVIISDQRMPGMNGSEFLERSRSLAPDAMRILLTGYSDISATIDAINRGGACRYVSKPWNDGELVQTVRDAARQYSLTVENQRLTRIVQQQNEELAAWNDNLKERVKAQTTQIRLKIEELQILQRRAENGFRGFIDSMSRVIEMRDIASRNHSRRVAELSVKAAAALGLSATETENVRIAALLHDVGKIALPDILMVKRSDELAPEDFALYRQHVIRGQMSVDAVEELREVGILIRHHHESFDGSGFPDALRGESIPAGAAIIGAADFVDRKFGDYVGKNAMELVLQEMDRLAGKKFAPDLCAIFRSVAPGCYQQHIPDEERIELELNYTSLRPGMILARDVISGTGMLLLSAFTELDDSHIVILQRGYANDPSSSGVRVLARR